MGFKAPEFASPLNMMTQVSQLQAAQDANALRQLQAQQLMRAQEQENALRSRLSSGAPMSFSEAAAFGAPGLQALTAQRAEIETQEKRQADKLQDLAEGLMFVRKDPSLENFSEAFRLLKSRGLDMGSTAAEIMLMGPEDRKKAVDRFIETTPGMSKRLLELDKIRTETEAARVKGEAAASQASTAAAKLPFERQRAEAAMISARAAADKQTTERKTELQRLQELRDSLPVGSVERAEVDNVIDARGRSAAPTLTDIVDPDDPTRMLKVDARLYTGGGFTAPGVVGIAGREPAAGKRATEQATARSQFLDILDTLQANFDELNRQRAIPSEQRGAVSNVLSSIEASGPGQVAGRAVGAKAQSLRDEIKSSRMALMSALKKLTGKSASELNSNVELRLNLDAISDPSQSYEAATKILENLKQFYAQEPAPTPAPGGRPGVTDRRSSSSSTTRGTAPSEVPAFRTVHEAEAANLPKGTRITVGGRPAEVN
jgi:hypothetical protein